MGKKIIWVAAAALFPVAPAHSYCFSPEELRLKPASYFAEFVLTNADVIIDATVVRRFDYPHPEVLKVNQVSKGPKRKTFTLAVPTDFILTSGFPSTGFDVGERAIIALRKGQTGYFASECDAGALGETEISDLVILLASQSQ